MAGRAIIIGRLRTAEPLVANTVDGSKPITATIKARNTALISFTSGLIYKGGIPYVRVPSHSEKVAGEKPCGFTARLLPPSHPP